MFRFSSREPADEKNHLSISIIGAGTIITGDIECPGDIRIDGTLKGNLFCNAKVLLGPEAIVEGNITGRTGNIQGKIIGNISIHERLQLHGKAIVEGDIHAGELQVEASVSFNGKCHMTANVVALKKETAIPIAFSKAVNE